MRPGSGRGRRQCYWILTSEVSKGQGSVLLKVQLTLRSEGWMEFNQIEEQGNSQRKNTCQTPEAGVSMTALKRKGNWSGQRTECKGCRWLKVSPWFCKYSDMSDGLIFVCHQRSLFWVPQRQSEGRNTSLNKGAVQKLPHSLYPK